MTFLVIGLYEFFTRTEPASSGDLSLEFRVVVTFAPPVRITSMKLEDWFALGSLVPPVVVGFPRRLIYFPAKEEFFIFPLTEVFPRFPTALPVRRFVPLC